MTLSDSHSATANDEMQPVASISSCGNCPNFWMFVERMKYFVSTIVVICCIAIVAYGISMDHNVADFGGPGSEIFIFFGAMLLLASNEGFQVRNRLL
jgi:hypothetical protein